MLFPKAVFLVTTFAKISKSSIFLLNFYQIKFKSSQRFVFFVKTHVNLAHDLLNFFEKYAKILDVSNFLKNHFEKFRKFLKISQQFMFFVQKREKLTHCLLNFLKKC